MQLAALCDTEMAREFTSFRVAESVLGCSPSNTSYVEVVGELATEF
jgi:hypothetical protein